MGYSYIGARSQRSSEADLGHAMDLVAIDSKSGRVLLRQSGTLSENSFLSTLHSSFPNLVASDITLVRDGQIDGQEKANKKAVVWQGNFFDLGGYSLLNREIAFRLVQRNFSVKLNILRTAHQVDPKTTATINALASVKLKNESSVPLVVGFTPMPVQGRLGRKIFLTMMETSDGLHEEFVTRCNQASEIWTPSEWGKKNFKDNGIVKPIYVMPLGVNEKIFVPDAKEPQLRYEEMPSGKIVEELPDGFRYASLFGWSFRKGPDVLCKSFLKEFSSLDDVLLVIYSRYFGSSSEPQKEHVRKEIREYYKEVGNKNPPRIYYCGEEIPILDLPGCYAAADCFVYCSRGEGFGLETIEAAACNVPVICTLNTAQSQYLDDSVADLVRHVSLAPANDKLTWITEFYRDQLFPVLGEVEIAEFGRLMRQAYNDPTASRQKAEKFRKRVLEEYTWDKCVDRVEKRLNQM